MKFLRLAAIFFVSLLFSFSASALQDDHLVPEDSIFASPKNFGEEGYHENLLAVFSDAYTSDISARVIVTRLFSDEYVIALQNEGESFKVITLTSSHFIGQYTQIGGLSIDRM